jgi:hypothetical protein
VIQYKWAERKDKGKMVIEIYDWMTAVPVAVAAVVIAIILKAKKK